MAKQGLYGKFRGKLADVVGYKVANAKRPGTIATRAYVAEIANPKTNAQATQRMRMKPAINFYRGLAALLDHSWQGVKYGSRSRAKFMQLALTSGAYNIPFVDKGESRFIPGEYPVSIGSVSANTANIYFDSNTTEHKFPFWSALAGLESLTPSMDITWGQKSAEILSLAPFLQDGDEITCIGVYEINGLFIPIHKYLVLDVSSLASAADVFETAGILLQEEGEFIFSPSKNGNNWAVGVDYNFVAAAVIVSRHPSKTSTIWMRSSSYMVCSDAFKAQWMSNSRLAAAKQTYMSSEVSLTSDWLLNQSENQGATSLNPATIYLVENKVSSIGGLNVSMANLTVDGANTKPVIYQSGSDYFYGLLQGSTVVFTTNQQLSSVPQSGQYYTKAEAAAAATSYSWDTSAIDDEPQPENP